MVKKQRLLALQRFQQQQAGIHIRNQMAKAGFAGQIPALSGQGNFFFHHQLLFHTNVYVQYVQ